MEDRARSRAGARGPPGAMTSGTTTPWRHPGVGQLVGGVRAFKVTHGLLD